MYYSNVKLKEIFYPFGLFCVQRKVVKGSDKIRKIPVVFSCDTGDARAIKADFPDCRENRGCMTIYEAWKYIHLNAEVPIKKNMTEAMFDIIFNDGDETELTVNGTVTIGEAKKQLAELFSDFCKENSFREDSVNSIIYCGADPDSDYAEESRNQLRQVASLVDVGELKLTLLDAKEKLLKGDFYYMGHKYSVYVSLEDSLSIEEQVARQIIAQEKSFDYSSLWACAGRMSLL